MTCHKAIFEMSKLSPIEPSVLLEGETCRSSTNSRKDLCSDVTTEVLGKKLRGPLSPTEWLKGDCAICKVCAASGSAYVGGRVCPQIRYAWRESW